MGSGSRTLLSVLTVFFSVWLALRFLFPLISPFLLGSLLALSAEPVVSLLNRKLRLPRGLSAGVGVSLTFCLLALILLALGAFLVRELGLLAGILPDLGQTARSGMALLEGQLLDLTARTPQSIQPLLRENVTAFFSDGADLLSKALRFCLSLAGNLLSHIPDSALSFGTAIISGFMISAKLPKIRLWLRRRFPKEKLRPLLETGRRMKSTLFGWLAAQCKLMGATLLILLLGLIFLRIPYAPLWAVVISLVDALPVLGTGTVLIPWALVSYLQGDIPRSIGLLGLYAVITLTRSLLEPKLLGRHLGLDPLATLVALYIGYQLWGIGGMILAPMLAVTALQLVPGREA